MVATLIQISDVWGQVHGPRLAACWAVIFVLISADIVVCIPGCRRRLLCTRRTVPSRVADEIDKRSEDDEPCMTNNGHGRSTPPTRKT